MSLPLGHTMSDLAAENDSESSLPVFRPFTREELAVIDERIQEKRLKAEKKAERRARNKAVSLVDKQTSYLEIAAAQLRGSILASHPAALGLISSIPEFFSAE